MAKVSDKRAIIRNEIKEKNKQIVKICYNNGGNYRGSFLAIQKAIIGEYALNKFNEYYNRDNTKRHKSIINYLSLENLNEYLEKLELIISEALSYNLSISDAIKTLKQNNMLSPITDLHLDENILNKANKQARDLLKNFPKDKLENIIDEPELKEVLKNKEESDIKLIKQLEEEIYLEYLKEQKEIEDLNKFNEETDYNTDDYYDFLNGKGDYLDEDERDI